MLKEAREKRMSRKLGSAVLAISVLWAVISFLKKDDIGVSQAFGPTISVPITGALKHVCKNAADFEGCAFSVDLLPAFIENSAQFNQFAADEAQQVLDLGKNTSCDSCVNETSVFEAELATNGTVQNIVSTLDAGCVKFPPFLQSQCESDVSLVPSEVATFLAQGPPVTACQLMGFCP